ncbi:hypothetical protein N7489_006394 [Penicillium chrysogenum]|uniref:uncharacterized protein n=1 Tax=Penicillium chrysogenum TaxID=5076 RepID=UPI0024DF07DE|nr:uncharacterized protein N7489_006394 [Penicillium chrysogenum]KAJ5236303.1 hypothetical protein N7489_006394 [Penicillium chrysogenum]
MAMKSLIGLVLILIIGRLCYLTFAKIKTYRNDSALGAQHGCALPPELPKKWPLGIDRIKDLWETNADDYGFGARPKIFAPLLGNGIFTQEGSAWKHSRELLRKQFVRVQSQNLSHFREHVDNLITRLPSSGVIDLQPLFLDLTLDIATALLFGRSVYALRAGIDQDKENKLFAESFSIAQEGLAKRFRIAPWHFLYNPPAFRKACANVHRFVEGYVKELGLEDVENYDKNQYGFIKQVAEESKNMKELRDQLLNVLLAGRDTTACCLSWTFRLLVRHAHVMERLRREIASVMEGGTTPSLRLYPPVPLNNREAVRTTILPTGGGPEGDKPMLEKNIYGHDAYEFRPERWESGELANIGWGFFPFSGGPRQCLGEDFAQMEVSYTTVRMLQAFSHISLPVGEPNEPVGSEKQQLTLVLSSAEGCKVEISKG